MGAQVAHAGANYNLLLRVIGCPSLIGNVKYSESVAGTSNFDASGTYRGSNFIEIFAEYGYRVNERSSMGLFGRFNSTRGVSNLTLDAHPGVGVPRTF